MAFPSPKIGKIYYICRNPAAGVRPIGGGLSTVNEEIQENISIHQKGSTEIVDTSRRSSVYLSSLEIPLKASNPVQLLESTCN